MTLHMVPSPWLYDFLKGYERYRPTAYAATQAERAKGIWTIGWGHTKSVKEGDTCTMAEAMEWLQDDVAEAVLMVCSLVKVTLSQNQFDALVSLVFNAGPDPLHKTMGHKLNAGDYAGAHAEFTKWDHQGGVWIKGLDIRRDAEAARFALAA
jgi:lysozyme